MSWRLAATSRAPRGAQPGPDPPVAGHEVDPVAGPGGQRGEQQRGVHRGVEPRHVLDPAGRGPRGVEHQHHAAVPLGLPGADHDVAVAGAGPPVDRADVVAADVLAQRVELGALAAHPDRGPAVELAEPGQPAGQVLAGLERRQRADRAGDVERLLPGAQAERPAQPGGHADGAQVAAAPRLQRRSAAAPGRPATRAIRCRLPVAPAVGCQASRTTPRTRRRPAFSTQQHRLGVVPQPDRADRAAAHGQALRPAAPAAGRRRRGRRPPAARAAPCSASGRSTTGTSPRRSSSGTRPVMTMSRLSGGPAPS